MRFIREKAVKSAEEYKEVGIFQLTTEQDTFSRKRTRRKLSTPKQVRQDWKHAKQYAVQLVNANFDERDYLVDLTYFKEPPDREQAEKDVYNYVCRLKRLYKKFGLELKAFWVTGGGKPKKNGEEGLTRFHHHLIISGGIPRELVEDAWNAKNNNRVRCYRVKICCGEFGLEPRVRYMVKPAHCSDEPNAKRWRTAGKLKKPVETRNDNRFDWADYSKLVKAIREGKQQSYIERLYKGWQLLDAKEDINPVTGLSSVSIKLKKKNTKNTR